VLVTRQGMASATSLQPSDVDREFVLMYSVMNENGNLFLQDNIDRFLGGVEPADTALFQESNLKHAINGFLYCYRDGVCCLCACVCVCVCVRE
jgi:hypothetical protein